LCPHPPRVLLLLSGLEVNGKRKPIATWGQRPCQSRGSGGLIPLAWQPAPAIAGAGRSLFLGRSAYNSCGSYFIPTGRGVASSGDPDQPAPRHGGTEAAAKAVTMGAVGAASSSLALTGDAHVLRTFLQTAVAATASLLLPRFLLTRGDSFWFLHMPSGEAWSVDDPVAW
jgi:hypothetical protein